MSNTLTGLMPTLYSAMNEVSRELIGFIPNVNIDAKTSTAAVGQTVRSPVVPQGALEDIVAGAAPASSGDQNIGYVDVSITKSKAYPIRWTGEEQLQLSDNGVINTVLRDQFAQGMRTIANAVEADLGGLYAQVAMASGTAGTTPFGSANDHTDFADANRILDVLGAPASNRIIIVGSTARANLEAKQSGLFKVNEAGTDGLLRRRELSQLHGFGLGYSAGIQSVTKGAGTGYLVNKSGGHAIGDTTITLDTGTVNTTGIKAGDVITFGSDTNKYVVKTGLTATSGDIVLTTGLKAAVADNAALAIGNSYTANMFYHKNALLLAARAPAMPIGGDSADDVTTIVDPISGLAFQVAVYRQYRQVKYEIGLSWGVAAPNGKHAGILLG